MRTHTIYLALAIVLICPFVSAQSVRSSREHSTGPSSCRPAIPGANVLPPKQLTGTPLPGGSYTVGSTGDFATLESAFNRLSGGGVLGPVTLLLIDTVYQAWATSTGSYTLVGPIIGTGPSSRITIRPADNVSVTIKGSGSATLIFQNVSYLTLDGIGLEGNTRLFVHTAYNPPGTSWNDGIDFIGDCDFAIIRNLTAGTDDVTRLGTGAIVLWADSLGAPDSCLVSGVRVTSGGLGIFVGGLSPSYAIRLRGNVIRDNHIGSPIDSLISRGIELDGTDGTVVENNHIENVRLAQKFNNTYWVLGIYAYYCFNAIIRSNVVHGLRGSNGAQLEAISVAGSTAEINFNPLIYNNMIYDIENKSTTGSPLTEGIILWRTSGAFIAYNTVFLSGTGRSPNIVDALTLGVGATNCTVRNNILVNTYHQTEGDTCDAMYVNTSATFASDYNDLYVDTLWPLSVTVYNTKGYRALTQWRGTGSDAHSVCVMPPFVSPQDLHLSNTQTAVADAAWPIPGLAADIDGDPRPRPGDPAPDIGADEFVHPPTTTGVEDAESGVPRWFALEQNYPNPFNPSTTIKFDLPNASNVRLGVYDILGREVSVLVKERRNAGVYEVKFDGSNLSSGVYFYRLSAGSYVETRKLLLLR